VGSRLRKASATSGERQIHHKSGRRGRAFIEREGMTQNVAVKVITDEAQADKRPMSEPELVLVEAQPNSAHAANGLTAIFIATGQEVANISESHGAITYERLLDNGDYYWSITLTRLIVGAYGGTGLPTERECLELVGCYGKGKARKLAEICAAAVPTDEISLTSAVLTGQLVDSHERLGRNR
jgi:hydroxymethylglutaryl-CoA reductase (NADPH)